MTRLTVDALKDLVISSKGFACQIDLEEDVVYMIPSGFLIIATSKGCASLRWGVSSDDADTNRVKMMLDECIGAFAEFRSATSSFAKFSEFLGQSITS